VTTSAPRARRLPLLPAPFLDETFGSWIFRAAVNYHMTTREFARGIIALERQLLPHTCDFDTEPPEALITALTKRSGYRRSELERLIVRPTGATLRPRHRDAYCPKCMREDRDTHEFDNVASVGVFLHAEQYLRWECKCEERYANATAVYPRLSSLLVTPERAARPNAHLISLKGIVPLVPARGFRAVRAAHARYARPDRRGFERRQPVKRQATSFPRLVDHCDQRFGG
jgi:TniQ